MEKSPISEYLKNITTSPGVYKFLNNKDRVIYVGKVKNLNGMKDFKSAISTIEQH